jgi:hypothetical protein
VRQKTGGRKASEKTDQPIIRARLSPLRRGVLTAIAPQTTQAVELSIDLLNITVIAAAQGEQGAIDRLREIGIELVDSSEQVEDRLIPIIVRRPDGSTAAWIF